MTRRWKTLDRILSSGASPLEMATPSYSELAVRIHEALASSDSSELHDLTAQLAETVDAGLSAAPAAARAAAEGAKNAGVSEKAAYALGQYGFAYQIVANAMNGRAEKGFEQRILVGTLAPYVTALARQDLSGTDLAEKLDRATETVSRNLRELRAMGAVDFRRIGTRLINFLTPAARQLFEASESGKAAERPPIAEPVREWVENKTQEQKPIMRDPQSFARQPEPV